MNVHPNSDEWMSFLYGEDSPARHAELDAHLGQCTACRQQVQTWRASMSALDGWKLAPVAPRRSATPVLQWAAAAAIVIGLGFGLGRLSSSPAGEIQQVRAVLQKEMDARFAAAREDFTRSIEQQHTELAQTLHAVATEAVTDESENLVSRIAKLVEQQRAVDQRALLAALKQLEEQQLDGYASLRQDIDTVAVNADDGLSQTQEQLLKLATLTQSSDN